MNVVLILRSCGVEVLKFQVKRLNSSVMSCQVQPDRVRYCTVKHHTQLPTQRYERSVSCAFPSLQLDQTITYG